MKRIIRHASLFSGIGAPELAAFWLGWQNLFHCEISEFCNTILNYWYPNSIGYENIKTTDFSEWKGKVDVLTGGFPCQPFSSAGQRLGADDDRYLWPEMFRTMDWLITPVATDGKRALMTMDNLKAHRKPNAEKSNLSEQIAHKVGGGTSQLSPLFVEEMMGYPLIYLVLPFLSQDGDKKR